MNLDTTEAQTSATFTFELVAKSGIYKVIVYAASATDSVAGWQVKLTDTTGPASSSQSNAVGTAVDCDADNATQSTGLDGFQFICDSNIAADKVEVVNGAAVTTLAEVVIVGFAWDSYPCDKGYYSTDGAHDAADDCKECDVGSYQNKFNATVQATSCTSCDRSSLKNLYTSTLEHKQADSCQFCDVGKVVEDSDLGTCVLCPAGQEFKADGSGDCDYDKPSPSTDDVAVTITNVEVCNEVECQACGEGTYNDGTTPNFCKWCADGAVPNAGKTSCEDCSPGEYMLANRTACEPCAAGEISAAKASACTPCATGEYTTDNINCLTCGVGQESLADKSGCKVCTEGKYKGSSDNECKDCPAGHRSDAAAEQCDPCPTGKKEVNNVCELCDPGTHQNETGKETCKTCSDGTYSSGTGSVNCQSCDEGQESNAQYDACVDCSPGYYQNDDDGDTCEQCPEGHYSNADKTVECTQCDAGKYQDVKGQTSCKTCDKGTAQPESGKETCVDCLAGFYADVVGLASCKPCSEGTAQSLTKQEKCVDCGPGEYQNLKEQPSCKTCESGTYSKGQRNQACDVCGLGQIARVDRTDCELCPEGKYQNKLGGTACLDCPANFFCDEEGLPEAKECPTDEYSEAGSLSCLQCPDPDDIETVLASKLEQKEKCQSDLGAGCYSTTTSSNYGDYSTNWIDAGKTQELDCQFDEPSLNLKVIFFCNEVNGKGQLVPEYQCKSTNNTDVLNDIASSNKTEDDKALEMEELTKKADNGIGDVEAVTNILESITAVEDGEVETVLAKNITSSIVKTVSNLVVSDLGNSANTTDTAAISNELVQQVVEVAKTTTVKNVPVASSNVAVISIKQEQEEDGESKASPSNNGLISFSVPSNNDLKDIQLDTSEDDSNTILLIETKEGESGVNMDLAIVLIADDTLMPDVEISLVPELQAQSIAEDILNDLESAMADIEDDEEDDGDEEAKKTYVNSLITEVQITGNGTVAEDFELNLYLKPTLDIGPTSESVKTSSSTGKRLQVEYQCAMYNVTSAKWESSCDTIYDKEDPGRGVLCLCNHNTSFAVLMSAYEIDKGYAQSQTILTQVLLGLSMVGLVATLLFLLPAKALRSTRSAKINICFTFALFLASFTFLLQDALIKEDGSGVIKVKSVGCAVYAMIQHYLWIAVFCWMVIEGFLMYLSLVQVFGSHISKYMLKFNLLAWGIPLPFPLIGYFAFTKSYTVGSFTFTKHGYLADTMCFVRPESIPFFVLFLVPLILVILINLVFFGLVVKVIKNSKSSGNVSDQEQLLRQLKAAVGVMVLLGTGWFFGIFMSIPGSFAVQTFMQYVFILLNSAQGIFVFVFYIVLNDQVKGHWLVKLGLREEKKSGTSSAATKSSTMGASQPRNNPATAGDNIYENANADHTYASAEYASADKEGKCEFPARTSDDNANI